MIVVKFGNTVIFWIGKRFHGLVRQPVLHSMVMTIWPTIPQKVNSLSAIGGIVHKQVFHKAKGENCVWMKKVHEVFSNFGFLV